MTQILNALRPAANLSAFGDLVSLLGRHRALTLEMARREIAERYSGQMFGALWAIGHPLFMMGLYVFIFAVVFKNKVGGTYEMPLDYTSYILAGLIPWMAFQDVLNKSCVAVNGNSSLVKQVVFPLEVLPVKGVLTSLLNLFISLSLLIAYALVSQGSFPWTYLLLPLLLAMQVAAMVGVAFALSAIGVFFRDIKDLMQLFSMAGMFLIPVVYLPTWVPGFFRPVMYANPFSYLIWCYQDVFYFGRIEHSAAWGITAFCSMAVFVLGFRLFRRLKPAFSNML